MSPSPEQIRKIRNNAKLTQEQAGFLVGVSGRAWRHWEGGSRKMPFAAWELFLAKTNGILSGACPC